MKKTIAIVANEVYGSVRGGVARFLNEIAPRLARSYRVKMILPGLKKQVRQFSPLPNLEVYEFPGIFWERPHKFFTFFGPRALRPILKSDLLFAQSISCALPLYFAHWSKRPIVMYLHGLDWTAWPRASGLNGLSQTAEWVYTQLTRYCFRRVRRILLPTHHLAEAIRTLGVEQIPCRVVPLGVDSHKFTPAQDRDEEKRKMGFSPQDLVLGYVGRLSREKNVSLLLNSFDTLHRKFPHLKLLVVGNGVPEIEGHLKGSPDIRWMNWQDDVTPFYRSMDIFCMPSHFETTSLATMEAMASGVPPVVMKVGRLQEYMTHEESGMLVKPEEESDYTAALEKLIVSQELRQKIGKKAREQMHHYLSWDDTVEQLSRQFEEVIRCSKDDDQKVD